METHIIIADDHPLFRDAMCQAITNLLPDCKIESAGDLDKLQSELRELGEVDLVLLDLTMPGASGFSGLISVRAEFPGIPVMVVSATEDAATIRKCIDLGASGFIPKSLGTELIGNAVKTVLGGEIWVPSQVDLEQELDGESDELIEKLNSLTPQQARVLSMLGQGLLNKQIAYELGVSEATVKAHVSAVLLKLDVDSRTQAVITMNRIGAGLFENNQAI